MVNCVRGLAGQRPTRNLALHSQRLPERGAFFVSQSDKLISLRICCRIISDRGDGYTK